jgi:hypothetical protein
MNTDYKLLAEQKQSLLKVIDRYEALHSIGGSKTIADHMTGILHLLDALQDAEVDTGTPEEKVFPDTERPWMLAVSMFTDDDCELTYKGDKYCFYNWDLKFVERFTTKEEAIEHLKLIHVNVGDKASKWTTEWLADCAEKLRQGETQVTFNGNQEYDIELREIKEK